MLSMALFSPISGRKKKQGDSNDDVETAAARNATTGNRPSQTRAQAERAQTTATARLKKKKGRVHSSNSINSHTIENKSSSSRYIGNRRGSSTATSNNYDTSSLDGMIPGLADSMPNSISSSQLRASSVSSSAASNRRPPGRQSGGRKNTKTVRKKKPRLGKTRRYT
mmetsp:Transcript_34908/g.56181  ORF Transcript_34908/g.56181 Transcript_34908/m.56181 type:complete len:167 (+) Transcript_34908:62-562(+)